MRPWLDQTKCLCIQERLLDLSRGVRNAFLHGLSHHPGGGGGGHCLFEGRYPLPIYHPYFGPCLPPSLFLPPLFLRVTEHCPPKTNNGIIYKSDPKSSTHLSIPRIPYNYLKKIEGIEKYLLSYCPCYVLSSKVTAPLFCHQRS